MSDPNTPRPGDDDARPEGNEWQPQYPPPPPPPQGPGGYQGMPPPQPPYGQPPYGGQQPPYGGQPGYGGYGGYGGPPPNIPNYLVYSILATILCCLPTGIVAIVYASQVNSKLAAGDIAGAQKSSQNARLWSIISVVLGLVAGFFVVALGMAQDTTV